VPRGAWGAAFFVMSLYAVILALGLALLPVQARAASLPPLDAANCVECHAESGGDPALPRLAGRNAGDIVAAMEAFRSGARPATVMDRIAKGFSSGEIAAIAAWYAAQK
jgi:sulfide dehydrogenase cytochrome subunit